MKKHLNTLFVTTQGAYLAKEGETVVVKVEGKAKLRLPIHTLDSIVCFGNVGASPFLLGFCGEQGVTFSFLTEYGRFLARVQGRVSGNVLLRRQQYRFADDPDFSARLATSFVVGKIANSRHLLKRIIRDHGDRVDVAGLEAAIDRLNNSLERLRADLDLDTVRGIEGDAAHVYFQVFAELILTSKQQFPFVARSRRPPMDRVNCLLSFIYTMLMNDIRSGLESVGLDPAVGFLHRDRPGRMGLALDMMEEFRPWADRIVLALINLGQVKEKGFTFSEGGGVRMDDATRKTVLTVYQKKKQDVLLHPFIDEKMPAGLLFHTQALLLSRFFREDLDGYPPMIWR
jgi:CRISPR-associated protein Cas1